MADRAGLAAMVLTFINSGLIMKKTTAVDDLNGLGSHVVNVKKLNDESGHQKHLKEMKGKVKLKVAI